MASFMLDIGIIGCGRMGRWHAERIALDGRARVAAVLDASRGIAESLRDEAAPDAAVVSDLSDLLRIDRLDAVVICTPTAAHFEQAVACRERGLHVLCEKPLAAMRGEIAALIESAQRGGPKLTVAYQRRFWGTYRTLRREVLSGRWGPVRAVVSHNVENWQQTIAGTWRDDPAVNWGGFVGDAGSHRIDAVFYVTDLRPRDVFARTDRCGSRVEITASAVARLEGDVPLSMDFIGHAQYLGEDLHVTCAEADLMIRDGRLWIGRNGQVQPLADVGALEPHSEPVHGFLDELLDGAEPLAPPACALPVYDFTRALLESGRTGRVVGVDEHL